MTFSKIPIPIKGKGKLTGYKQRLASKMEMDGENMLLMAEIEVLKKEKDAALRDLEAAEMTISLLRSEILVMNETEKNQGIKHQVDISKLRASRNKSFNYARKIAYGTFDKAEKDAEKTISIIRTDTSQKIEEIQKDAIVEVGKATSAFAAKLAEVTKQKNEEIKEWKAKYDQANNTIIAHDTKTNTMFPVLSDADTTKLISLLNDNEVKHTRLWKNGHHEIVRFKFKSGYSMSSRLGLKDNDVTQFQMEKNSRSPLEPRTEVKDVTKIEICEILEKILPPLF